MRLVLVVGLVSLVCGSGRGVKLEGNGYEVLVAVSPAVNKFLETDVISSIKKMMTEASKVLFTATHNRMYFRKVNILLPATSLNTTSYPSACKMNFEDSDIRVEEKGMYGDQPYTVRSGGCGQPGRYVVLTRRYLTEDKVASWWGPRAKMMVHEWAKLRWGVFEEFGYPNDTVYPLLYWTNSEEGKPVLGPNYCSNKEPKGLFRDRKSGDSCHFLDGLPNDDCRFIPEGQQTASSSLMALYYLGSTKWFCDSAVRGKHRHDQLPPTRHNLLCNGLSVWDIIRLHSDFRNANSSNGSWPSPSFKVLRQVDAKYVLILDRSSDMTKLVHLKKVDHSIRWWILNQLDSTSSLAIITLADQSRIERNFTQLTDMNIRESLAKLLPFNESGKINMSEGLSIAMTQLNETSNHVFVVVAADDGESAITNCKLVNSSARLVLILLGSRPSEAVEQFAKDTGGVAYGVPDEDYGHEILEDALLASLAYQPRRSPDNPIIKLHEEVYRGKNDKWTGSFLVDSSVGLNLILRMSTNQSALQPSLISPNTSVYNSSGPEDTIHVALAERGVWTWEATLSHLSSDYSYIRASVTIQQRELGKGAIRVLVWVGPDPDQLDASNTPATIYAEVKQGSNPVVGSRVRAFVSQPNETPEVVVLRLSDEGRAADIQEGDGIYSRHLTKYSTEGRYTVTVEASGDDNTFIYTHCSACHDLPHERRSYCCGSKVPLDCMSTYPTGFFRRFSPKVVFQVTGLPPSSDPYPPGRVLDLQVVPSLSQVVLSWTATGDDYDSGIVYGYEIRLSESRSDLLEWSVGRACGRRVSVLLSLKESRSRWELFLQAGSLVSLRLHLLQPLRHDALYFVALQATDDENKKSLLSNVATVMVPRGPKQLKPWQVALLVFGCIVVIADLVGGLFYFLEKYYFQEMD